MGGGNEGRRGVPARQVGGGVLSDTFHRVTANPPSDAVVVTVWTEGDDVVADASWPPRKPRIEWEMTPLGFAVPVPTAIVRAKDAMSIYGFDRIVVMIDDPALWRDEWGVLADGEASN